MSENVGPIYEVTLTVDREIIDEVDVWLTNHVEEMLQIPGFVRASIFAAEDDDQGRPQRVTHYYLESEADLDNYLAGPAAVMRRSATDRFAGRFTASRRVLHDADMIDGALKPLERCLNCGTTLGGQYCGHCGQRSRGRLISIWELLRDAFGDLLLTAVPRTTPARETFEAPPSEPLSAPVRELPGEPIQEPSVEPDLEPLSAPVSEPLGPESLPQRETEQIGPDAPEEVPAQEPDEEQEGRPTS